MEKGNSENEREREREREREKQCFIWELGKEEHHRLL